MYSSGPDAFNYVFKIRQDDDVLEYLRVAFHDDRGELGYANHTVAELDGDVVGLGTAFSGRDMFKFMTGGLMGLLSFYGPLQTPRIISRVFGMELVIEPPKSNLHYVAHLGVTPDLRSRGIGRRLVEHLLEGGRKLGRSTAALDLTVADLMTREVTTCGDKDTIEQLMWLMTDQRIRHLPVADADGALGGIVSIGDVVKFRLGQLESENQALYEYITQGR